MNVIKTSQVKGISVPVPFKARVKNFKHQQIENFQFVIA